MFAELYLTNGLIKVDLLSGNRTGIGIAMINMVMARPQRSPAGIFRQIYGVANEAYTLKVTGRDHNDVAARLQELDSLIEQATNYFSSNVEEQIVWIAARTAGETNTRYAVLYNAVIESYGDVYAPPFTGGSKTVTEDITLGIERSAWLGNPPLTTTCLPTTNDILWNPALPTWSVSLAATNIQSLFTTDGGAILGGGVNIVRTTNGGTSWATEVTGGEANMLFWQFVQEPAGRIWSTAGMTTGAAVAACGLYYSDDNGDTWVQDQASINLYGIAYRPDDHTLFCGATDSIYYHKDGVFSLLSSAQRGAVKVVLLTPQNNIIAADSFSTWRIVNLTVTKTASEDIGAFIKADSTEDYLLLGSASYISISRDDGLTWFIYQRDWGIDGLAVLPNGSILASRSTEDEVYISYDGGYSWSSLASLANSPIRDFAMLSNSYLFAAVNNSIYRRIAVSAEYSYGAYSATCATPTPIANHRLQSNWTHIFVFDDSTGNYTAIDATTIAALQSGGTSVPMFPVPASNADIFYIGVSTSVVDAGVFNNVYLNLVEHNYNMTYAIQYWNGSSWVTFTTATLKDNTESLHHSGVIVWDGIRLGSTTINGIEAYWLRIVITNVGAFPSDVPELNNIYIVHQPFVEVSGVEGNIPAIAQMFVYNNMYVGASPLLHLQTGRVRVGVRSVDRGEKFTSILNFSSTQNPPNVTAAPGSTASFVNTTLESASEQFVRYIPVIENLWFPAAYIVLGSDVAKDFYGTYQVYIRLRHDGANDDECFLRLIVENFTLLENLPGDTTSYTPLKLTESAVLGTADLLHLGLFQILPDRAVSPSDAGWQTRLRIDILCTNSAGAYQTDLYDIVLIPADEWIGDFSVSLADTTPKLIGNADFLDIDSVSFPKRVLRSLVRRTGTNLISNVWSSNTSGALMLQPTIRQRLWFIFEHLPQASLLMSNWTMIHSIKLFYTPRWLGLRGND